MRRLLSTPAGRRLAWALLASALLHLALVTGPGWLVPAEDVKSVPIEAKLLPPPKIATAPPPPSPEPAPAPAPKPKRAAAPAPQLPQAQPLPEPVPVAAPEPPPLATAEPEPSAPAAAPEAEPEPAAPLTASEQPPAPDDLFPAHGRIVYAGARGAGGFVVATAESVWVMQDDRYEFRLYVQTVGVAALLKRILITYKSEGRISGNGFIPSSYRMEQNGQIKEGVTFDWQRRRVGIVSNKGHGEHELMEASQDFISAIFQLALFPPDASPTAVWVATGRTYTQRLLEVVGTEEVTTRLGPLRALRLRLGRDGDEQLDLWFALDIKRLPVRIRWIDRDGGINDFQAGYVEYDDGKQRVRLAPPDAPVAPAG